MNKKIVSDVVAETSRLAGELKHELGKMVGNPYHVEGKPDVSGRANIFFSSKPPIAPRLLKQQESLTKAKVEWGGKMVSADQLVRDTQHFMRNALSVLMAADYEGPEHYPMIIRDARELLEEFNNKYSESEGE